MVTFSRVVAIVAAKDLARAREFYELVLGLAPLRALPEGVMYEVGNSALFVYPSQWAGTAGNTVASFEVTDLRQAVADLRDRGVTFEDYDLPGLKTNQGIADFEGELSAWFRDTEGNILAIGQMR